MKPKFFAKASTFRVWLEKHHQEATELLVGFHKKASAKKSMTWPESVDEALCFGWIDGIRRRIDDQSYSIRFTPRRPKSSWSARNIGRMAELEASGRMLPAGRKAFSRRSEAKSESYAYEQGEEAQLDQELRRRFEAKRRAWEFFHRQPPGYRRKALWWVVSAKREATRRNRLQKLIECSEEGRKAW